MIAPSRPPGVQERTISAEFLHELRTPLNQIIGYSELLAEQAAEEGQAGFVPDLHKIRAAGWQLLQLINGSSGSTSLTGGHNAAAFPSPSTAASRPFETVFEPSVPAESSTDPPPGRPAEVSSQVLVVDDNELNRDMLSRRLERLGHEVVTALNGREAIEAMRAHSFDLVLLDIMMPEMDGYEVLRQLKADEGLLHVPVIMISALDELQSVVRCIEMGAVDYLTKPFNPTLLKARIGACLDKKHAHDRELELHEQCRQNYKQLQELERLREDLTHMIVHDLRTPLTSIIAGMQMLDVDKELNELQREVASIALRGGENLLGMINTLLDVEKLESGTMKLDYSQLSVADLIAHALEQVSPLTEVKNQDLSQHIPANLPMAWGDENLLLRTLVNLLGNAIKFTPHGGQLSITAFQDPQGLSLAVADTGEGIPAGELGHIFEKFGQVESRGGGNKSGTGLGLTFCKRVAEAHGGDLTVESTPGKGSTFCFNLPIRS